VTTKTSYAELTERLQCPGCVCGSNTDCGVYRQGVHGQCEAHVPGTSMGIPGVGIVTFALGFPKGFCRLGFDIDPPGRRPLMTAVMRTWELANGTKLEVFDKLERGFDKFNVPVACVPRQGRLVAFVWSPRVDKLFLLECDPKEVPENVIRLPEDAIAPEPYEEREVGIERRKFAVRFWKDGGRPSYGGDVRAVWAMRQDDLLFVRACRPATAERWVDVVQGAKRKELVPEAINVKDFVDKID
jgi:hypothetical protein